MEVVRWFEITADQGLAVAQFHLGLMFANGFGVTQSDMEAARWHRIAADQGYAKAFFF